MFLKVLLKAILPRSIVQVINHARERLHRRGPTLWARHHLEDYRTFMEVSDPNVAREAFEFSSHFRQLADKTLAASSVIQGGGGAYDLLYFLVMKTKPSNVVETGVASGWSSQAILSALGKLQHGHLHSNDLPYQDRDNSKLAVGILVDEQLKSRWSLSLGPDRMCLPEIARKLEVCDIFHYDSDKSYGGRQFAWEILSPSFSNETIIIFDDIQDNYHFRDLVSQLNVRFKVFEFMNKFVGVFRIDGKLEFD